MTHQEMEIKIKNLENRVKELEQQEPFMNKPCVASQVCHEDKVKVLDKLKGYVDHIRNTGMGKKKSLEFIEKFIERLKAESEE